LAGRVVAACLAALVGCTNPTLVRFPAGAGGVVDVVAPDVVGPIRLRGPDLIDATGRTVLIRGTNSVRKSEPFISPLADGWLGPADLATFRTNGWNGIRLGVWAARLMPEPRVVDDGYLDEVAAVVDALSAAGIWILLDFHQDVFWGMPSWATTPAAAALSDEVPPLFAPVGWAAGYLTDRSNRQWDDWWANVEVVPGTTMWEAFGAGVEAVAQRFAGSPNVIGIDLLNEPFAGSSFWECASVCYGRYQQVAQFFAHLTDRVRSVAPDLPVWWEPFTFGEPFPGVGDPGEGVGLSFHAYCLGTDGGEPVAPDPVAVAICEQVFANTFDGAARVSAVWDAPAMLTEFGASRSPLNASISARIADERIVSWFHWHAPPTWPEVVRTHLVRPYAQATAGRPTLHRFDPATGVFRFAFEPDHTVIAPTSVVVPPAQYPDGYEVTVTGGTVTSAPNAGRLTVVADPDADLVEVTISRRA
jgi:endoglycosylceramidase